MKAFVKVTQRIMVLGGLAVLLAACQKEEGNTQEPTIPETKVQNMTSGYLTYYGEDFLIQTNGNAQYDLFLFDGEIDYEWQKFGLDGYWRIQNANGTALNITAFCQPAQDFDNPAMTPGKYKLATSPEDMTFMPGRFNENAQFPEYTYLATYENGQMTDYKFATGGEFTLAIEGEKYIMDIQITFEDGETGHYTYESELKKCNLATPPYHSELEEDLDIRKEELGRGAILSAFQNNYNPNLAVWQLELLGKDVTIEANGELKGSGYYIKLGLKTDYTGEFESLPEGTYTLEAGDENPFTAYPGDYDSLMGESGSTLYLLQNGEKTFAPLSTGTIEVKRTGDTYRINIQGTDDNQHAITLEYEGILERYDQNK